MLPHLSRPKLLRLFAGAACVAASGAAGAILARQPDPIPPAAPLAVPAPVAPAGRPATPPLPAVPRATVSELTLARSVLAALDADPVLKDVNLIVSVLDRSAVVGGPVVSEEVRKRVEAVVRGVAGVESVKNACFVTTDGDPLLRAMAERLKPAATRAEPPPVLPGVAVGPTAPPGYLPPPPPPPTSTLLAGTPTVAARPQLPPVGVLGAPVSPAGAMPPARVAPLPEIPPAAPPPALPTAPGALTGATPAKPADLATAALAVVRTDPRYARLTVDLKADGALFVSGRSAEVSAVRDFVAELRKLPGAGRVVVDPALVR